MLSAIAAHNDVSLGALVKDPFKIKLNISYIKCMI